MKKKSKEIITFKPPNPSAIKPANTSKPPDKELSLGDKINQTLIKIYKDTILPSTITGRINIPWIPFNMLCSLELGTIVEAYGEFSSGKSLLMMMAGAATQKAGGLFICYNTEAANRDKVFLEKVVSDLDYDAIQFYQPETIEDLFNSIEQIVKVVEIEDKPVFIGIDSIAACASKYELGGKDSIGANARAISGGLRKLCSPLSKKPIILFMISQNRVDINKWKSPSTPTGGKAPLYYSSTVVNLSMTKFILNENNVPIGKEGKLYINKSRFSPAGRTIPFNFFYETGINKYEGLLDILIENGIIIVNGGWMNYNGKSFQRNGFLNIVDSFPELALVK